MLTWTVIWSQKFHLIYIEIKIIYWDYIMGIKLLPENYLFQLLLNSNWHQQKLKSNNLRCIFILNRPYWYPLPNCKHLTIGNKCTTNFISTISKIIFSVIFLFLLLMSTKIFIKYLKIFIVTFKTILTENSRKNNF